MSSELDDQDDQSNHGLDPLIDQENLEDYAGGLFGEGSEDEEVETTEVDIKQRNLDDEQLGSDDDEEERLHRDDDMGHSGDEEAQERAQTILDVSIGRHAMPKPSDGELYLLQFPNFIGIEPKAFDHINYKPPTADHYSSEPSSVFSPYQTSNNTIRWRFSPSNPSEIQSNARLIRWTDGSMTIQLASNAREQFELTAKPLAPPHISPLKTQIKSEHRKGTTNAAGPAYDSRLDSHTYLATPHELASLIRITNHVTSSLAVRSSSDQNDDALIKLQQSLAAATKGNKTAADGGLEIITIKEDPEQAKKRAEIAEKEKLRAQRRRQLQEDRERDRTNRVLNRPGVRTGSYGGGGGLTVNGLEDDDGGRMATTKARATTKANKKKSRRRNDDYSDEEEDYHGRGRTREDEYDEDDGFLVRSDEEPEIIADETDEEPDLEDDDVVVVKPKKAESPKRDNTGGEAVGRAKRRRIIDDEED